MGKCQSATGTVSSKTSNVENLNKKGKNRKPNSEKSSIVSRLFKLSKSKTETLDEDERTDYSWAVASSKEVSFCSGEPGIGKSTSPFRSVATSRNKEKCLYISGESVEQIAIRAKRLSITSATMSVITE